MGQPENIPSDAPTTASSDLGRMRLSVDQLKAKWPALMNEAEPPDLAEREHRFTQHRRDQLWHEREMDWQNFIGSRGERYSDCSLENYTRYAPSQTAVIETLREYSDGMASYVSSGRNIVLFGPPGTGKDHLLVALAREAIQVYRYRVRWENGLDLYGQFRDRINDDQPEARLLADLFRPEILYISDPIPPWGDVTSYQASMVYRIVDKRYSHRKPTWISLNVDSGSEAMERLGNAAVDRLRHSALLLHCSWESYRIRTEANHDF